MTTNRANHPQHRLTRLLAAHGWVVALAWTLVGCGSKVTTTATGGESHFLAGCTTTCGEALACIAQHCTAACTSDSECDPLASGARCLGQTSGRQACDVECTNDAACSQLGSSFVCDANRCRAAATVTPETTASLGTASSAGSSAPDAAAPPAVGTGTADPSPCKDANGTHAQGDFWLCKDLGCATCSCTPNGVSVLDDSACAIDCLEFTTPYAEGDTWRCQDGCADCRCESDGTISRTEEPGCVSTVTCALDGMDYPLGTTHGCSDGCNTCVCEADSAWHATTSEVCFTPGPVGVCKEGGASYAEGETWTCSDGCNTCSCNKDGQVAATKIGCVAPETDSGAVACDLPPEMGSCKAAFAMFYFDPATGSCQPFTYGGCEGNSNRFTTLEACQAACGGDAG